MKCRRKKQNHRRGSLQLSFISWPRYFLVCEQVVVFAHTCVPPWCVAARGKLAEGGSFLPPCGSPLCLLASPQNFESGFPTHGSWHFCLVSALPVSRDFLLLLSGTWLHSFSVYLGARDLNSGPHTCTANTLHMGFLSGLPRPW